MCDAKAADDVEHVAEHQICITPPHVSGDVKVSSVDEDEDAFVLEQEEAGNQDVMVPGSRPQKKFKWMDDMDLFHRLVSRHRNSSAEKRGLPIVSMQGGTLNNACADIFIRLLQRNFKRADPKRKVFSYRVSCSRFYLLLEELYPKNNFPRWGTLAKRPKFVVTPKQKADDCGFYVLKFMESYDGDKFVADVEQQDTSLFRNQYLYMTLFHHHNKAKANLPPELGDLAPPSTD